MRADPMHPRRLSETPKALLLTVAALAASMLLAGLLSAGVHALHVATVDATEVATFPD